MRRPPSRGSLGGKAREPRSEPQARAPIIEQTADEVFEISCRKPAARYRARTGEIALEERLLRLAQAVPERRLPLGADLPGARPAATSSRSMTGGAWRRCRSSRERRISAELAASS